MNMSEGEKKQLNEALLKMYKLKDYFNTENIDKLDKIENIYNFFVNFKKIQGNINNSISYIACLLAKEYLLKKHNLVKMDMSIKPQGANGLDIDENLENGKRIIGEIKTIYPLCKNDFGSAQRKSFRNDFKKLNNTNADYKYLFVTEKESYELLNSKYKTEIKDVFIVKI